uniref:Secreted protein n=1 Tax=Ixodes ricinus TaxID=34613 RepID=A0A147BD93_IXORI
MIHSWHLVLVLLLFQSKELGAQEYLLGTHLLLKEDVVFPQLLAPGLPVFCLLSGFLQLAAGYQRVIRVRCVRSPLPFLGEWADTRILLVSLAHLVSKDSFVAIFLGSSLIRFLLFCCLFINPSLSGRLVLGALLHRHFGHWNSFRAFPHLFFGNSEHQNLCGVVSRVITVHVVLPEDSVYSFVVEVHLVLWSKIANIAHR